MMMMMMMMMMMISGICRNPEGALAHLEDQAVSQAVLITTTVMIGKAMIMIGGVATENVIIILRRTRATSLSTRTRHLSMTANILKRLGANTSKILSYG